MRPASLNPAGQTQVEGIGLLDFAQRTYTRYQPAPHHRLLAEKLEAVERGEITRLMVFMPPRHGKSELASVRFPAWYLGRHPERKIIAASYAARLVQRFSRRTRNLLSTEAYQRLFPGVRVADDAAAVDYWAIDGTDGHYSAAGIGGGITGEGADLLLIDDPVKDAEEALSMTYRDAAYEWYTSTAYTRLDDARGAIVLIQTRWHEDDLAGKLLQEAADGGEQWEVVSLPALAEEGDLLGRAEGEALWPERFSAARLGVIRTTLKDERWWDALYQQRPPLALGGRYFRTFQATKEGRPWHIWPEAIIRQRYGLAATDRFPPRAWPAWAAVDGGVRDPWCCLFFCRAPNRRVFIYRELYGPGVQVPRQAQQLKRHCAGIGGYRVAGGDPEGDVLQMVKCDPSMIDQQRANTGVRDADVYAQQGVPMIAGYNRRIPGWRRLLEALDVRDDGWPGLVLVEGKAPNLARTLPRLTADPHDPEDVEDGQEDHAADCARYGINPAAAPDPGPRRVELRAELHGDGHYDAGLGHTGVQSEW